MYLHIQKVKSTFLAQSRNLSTSILQLKVGRSTFILIIISPSPSPIQFFMTLPSSEDFKSSTMNQEVDLQNLSSVLVFINSDGLIKMLVSCWRILIFLRFLRSYPLFPNSTISMLSFCYLPNVNLSKKLNDLCQRTEKLLLSTSIDASTNRKHWFWEAFTSILELSIHNEPKFERGSML